MRVCSKCSELGCSEREREREGVCVIIFSK